MKTLCTIALSCLACLNMASQETVIWSDPVSVASSDFSNKGPKTGINANGEVVAMWGKSSGDQKLLYTSVLQNGAFTDPVDISGDVVPTLSNIEGPVLHVNGQVVFAVFQESGNNQNGVYSVKSVDGGLTWDAPVQVISKTSDNNILPTVHVDGEGNPWIACLNSQSFNNTQLLLLYSPDGGSNFEELGLITEDIPSGELCECCPPMIHVSSTHITALFRNNDNNNRDIWMARKAITDESYGLTDCDEYDWQINACPASGASAVFSGDDMYTAYASGFSGVTQIYSAHIDLENNTIENNIPVTGFVFEETTQQRPSLAGNNEVIGVVWEHFVAGHNDLIFSFSTDQLNYEESINIGENSDEKQRYASLVHDNEGFHLVYADTDSGEVRYRNGTLTTVETVQENGTSQGYTIVGNRLVPNSSLVKSIQIYDLSGRLILDETNFINGGISISNLQTGVYLISLLGEGSQEAHKVNWVRPS